MSNYKIIILTMLSLWTVRVFAYDVEVDGIYYNLDHSDKTATVTYNDGHKYTGSVIIPSSIVSGGVTYDVTGIQARAFDECTGLNSISFPESMVTIGDFAFNGCTSLTSVSLPYSVKEIRPYAFAKCTGLTSFQIPSQVCELLSNLFDGCTNLVSVIIPEGVKTIDQNAFRDCASLTGVTIPPSTTFIGYGAFRNCSSLTTVTLPKDINRMNSYVFDGCINLKTVIAEMPTPTGIDDYVFCTETYAGKLVVPINSKELYQQAVGWRNFQIIVEAEEEPANDGLMLVVNLNDGSHEYYLLTEKPYFTFNGNLLSTVKSGSVVVYNRSDIKDFTFECGSADGIKAVEATGELLVRQIDEGRLVVCGLKSGTPITIYDIGGKLLQILKVEAAGKCEVNLPSVKGIYVINIANKRTIKILKK